MVEWRKHMELIMYCRLCHTESNQIFKHQILHKYDIAYYQCPNCGLIFTEKPYWLNESYSDAIADIDTGIMQRNLNLVNVMSLLLQTFFKPDDNYLDYGGGYGVFTRFMRDKGFSYFWIDKYAEPLLIKGFEYKNEKTSALTAFEVFEHLENPLEDIEKMLSYTKNIFFSTECYDQDMKVPDSSWWYWSYESGQHISLYSQKTLLFIAQKYKLNYYHLLGLHWFTDKKISKFMINYMRLLFRIKPKYRTDFKYCSLDMNYLKRLK